jgi:hypothetical protein
MRLAALLAACALPALAGCGSPDKPLTVSPPSHDFGAVLQGETRRKTFRIENHGGRTVGFAARANCSCFAVAQTLRPLDPGQTMEFTVIFSTTSTPAQRMRGKYITITTDHPDQSAIVIPLEGEIYRAFDVRPALFELGIIEGGPKDHEPHEVIVQPVQGRSVTVRGVDTVPKDVFDVHMKPFQVGGTTVTFVLREDARRPRGPFHVQARLQLDVRAPDGRLHHERAIVRFRGLWAAEPEPTVPK